jgi:hypothetical protein
LNDATFDNSVFVNCPFDDEFAPLLEAMLFCIVYAGLTPRLASEQLEGGASRLDKIVEIVNQCKFSVHDLSKCRASTAGEYLRMNMPFELGLDMGFRKGPGEDTNGKKFVIFEAEPYDLKRALSDLAGTDVEFHRNNFQTLIQKLRNFLRVEVGIDLPGAAKLETDYYTFQGWMTEKKIDSGHTEEEATRLPTRERLDEMFAWVELGKPVDFA